MQEEYETGTKDEKNDSGANNKPIISDPPPLVKTSDQEGMLLKFYGVIANCIIY